MDKNSDTNQPQSAMNAATLQLWRKRMGYSQQDACNELGCSITLLEHWEHGSRPVPRYIGLACAALALGMSAYSDGEGS